MNCRKGFTLIELLIVVLILGALAAIAIPRITSSAQTAKVSACAANIGIMNSQIEMWASENNGAYPANLGVVTGDITYFPDGPPVCPLGGTYSLNVNSRTACDH
jgi:prepilin-type N-terminal cleavage/methylation domain-containing protein